MDRARDGKTHEKTGTDGGSATRSGRQETTAPLGMSERERHVLDLLVENPGATVSAMSKKFQVSEATVRKTLEKLVRKGMIHRFHGGAAPAFHPDVVSRQRTNVAEKKRIAKRAAAMVSEGDTIMTNASTTAILVAKYLAGRRGIRVVTNSTLMLSIARENPLLHVILVGEHFRPETEALVGPMATNNLDAYHARIAFIGAAGFSVEHGLTAFDPAQALIESKFAERSDKTILVADSSKYGNAAFVRFLEIKDVDTIISDDGLPQEARDRLLEAGVELIIV